jgi:ATP-dependent DNA ligase
VDLPTEGSSRWGGGVTAEDMKALLWTEPELVVEIQFVEWTAEGRLRLSKLPEIHGRFARVELAPWLPGTSARRIS